MLCNKLPSTHPHKNDTPTHPHTNTHTHPPTHTQSHTHTHTHTHTNTHTHTEREEGTLSIGLSMAGSLLSLASWGHQQKEKIRQIAKKKIRQIAKKKHPPDDVSYYQTPLLTGLGTCGFF